MRGADLTEKTAVYADENGFYKSEPESRTPHEQSSPPRKRIAFVQPSECMCVCELPLKGQC